MPRSAWPSRLCPSIGASESTRQDLQTKRRCVRWLLHIDTAGSCFKNVEMCVCRCPPVVCCASLRACCSHHQHGILPAACVRPQRLWLPSAALSLFQSVCIAECSGWPLQLKLYCVCLGCVWRHVCPQHAAALACQQPRHTACAPLQLPICSTWWVWLAIVMGCTTAFCLVQSGWVAVCGGCPFRLLPGLCAVRHSPLVAPVVSHMTWTACTTSQPHSLPAGTAALPHFTSRLRTSIFATPPVPAGGDLGRRPNAAGGWQCRVPPRQGRDPHAHGHPAGALPLPKGSPFDNSATAAAGGRRVHGSSYSWCAFEEGARVLLYV